MLDIDGWTGPSILRKRKRKGILRKLQRKIVFCVNAKIFCVNVKIFCANELRKEKNLSLMRKLRETFVPVLPNEINMVFCVKRKTQKSHVSCVKQNAKVYCVNSKRKDIQN